MPRCSHRWREHICFPGWGKGHAGSRGMRTGWGGGSAEGRSRGGPGLHGGALRGSGWLCVRPAARPGSLRAYRGMHWAGGRFCVPGGRERFAAAPPVPVEGPSRWPGSPTHLLKSKGIVPSLPGVGALQARAPRGSLPAANASSGRPAPAGRPPPRLSPLASRRREVTLCAAHWAPPAPDTPSAAGLKEPAGREGEELAFLGGDGNPQRRPRPFPAPQGVLLPCLPRSLRGSACLSLGVRICRRDALSCENEMDWSRFGPCRESSSE